METPSSEPVALITGGSRGIGAAAARAMADAGWAVALSHEPTAQMAELAGAVAESIGARCRVYPADLQDPEAPQRVHDRIVRDFGRLDAVVCNAAVDQLVPWDELTLDDWSRTMDVNVRSGWLLVKAARRSLAACAQASVVMLTSTMVRTGQPGRLHYTASKAALIGMTRALARELGADGIRVNAVMPGAIRTESETERFGDDVDDAVIAMQALPRRGTAEDVAGAIRFLLGADASFITGQVLCVDGGMTF